MFPELHISLEKNHSYTNSWNFFSKWLILKSAYKKYKKIILIVENDKLISQYKKVFDYIRQSYKEVETQSSLINLAHAQNWLFLIKNYSLKEEIITHDQLLYFSQKLKKWESYQINSIIKKITQMWYEYSDFSNHWTYKKNGDILSIVSFDWEYEYKLSFWWEILEEILEIKKFKEDIISSEEVQEFCIWWNKKIFHENGEDLPQAKSSTLQQYIINSWSFTVLDSLDFSEYYEQNTKLLTNFCCFDFVTNKQLIGKNIQVHSPNIDNIDNLKEILSNSNVSTSVYTKNTNTITNFLEYNGLEWAEIHEIRWNFLKSFEIEDSSVSSKKQVIICDDVLGKIFIKKRINKNVAADLDLLLKITPGDYVVHIDHGIWIFKSVIKKELPTNPHSKSKRVIIKEYIEISYKWEDKLFVPITEVSRVNKFIGPDNPKLTGLNTTEWSRKLKKVDESIQRIAEELLEIYSQRKLWRSFAFLADSKKEASFQASFPYTYTSDQDEAINEILDDMSKSEPMDRLLVWDVWFGKTEVAFNAIYRSFINKKQSVFIAPLVVLAYEHYEKALERFRWMWMSIAVITRMESASKVHTVLSWLKQWSIDLVIWTHRLLSDKISYKNLWLLVVDEEHKFGVSDKEKIKKLKTTIDILSMSATPIPRSLNMALSQIRQISIIKTPPQGRKDINTIISKYSERVILDWCNSEFERWWQVYFVHNRVQTLVHFEKVLHWLFPDKKVIITHGQLPGNTLEKRIIDFKNKKYDILLTTTVIENGIDFPNVNTIFINEAQQFWISQIHQLRWRVWRSDRLGHCYLLYKKENLWTETAKRLKTIVNYSYLWAWFELAMKDLEIRWWWDLLWCRQSGQSSEIWVNLYLKLIEQKVNELKNNNPLLNSSQQWSSSNSKKLLIHTKIDLQLDIWIPDQYFDSELDKINFYREIESLTHEEDLQNLIEDFSLENNLKELPEQMQNFFTLLTVKLKAQHYNIIHIKKVGVNYQLDFEKNTNLEELKRFLDLDLQVKFVVASLTRLRSSAKNFTNAEFFLQYLLKLFDKNIWRKKVKLKGKIIPK